MKSASKHLAVVIIALIFSWLFFKRSAGINLLIFDILVLATLFQLDREKLQSTMVKLFFAGTLLSGVLVAWHNSTWSIIMHHVSFMLLGGALAAPQLKSVLNIFMVSFFNAVLSIKQYFVSRKQEKTTIKRRPLGKVWYALRVSIIPLLIVILFGTLYSNASPWFHTIWAEIGALLDRLSFDFLNMISFTWLFTFIFGLILAIYLLFANAAGNFDDVEAKQSDDMQRTRERYRGRAMGLKREMHVAVILFVALNIMLFGQNLLDFTHVWIGFEWNGEYLKQFVHEGTYLLILSIVISAGLVLFYFRGNLNYFKKNKTLRLLAYIWIFQNMFLAASVAVRNIWYIDYFNLAYKRIGVFFFLIAVLYGLYTVFLKVRDRKSIHFLIRVNSLAAYIILMAVGLANWDTLIAKYNFAHAQDGYLHLDFMSKLSDQALPYLEYPVDVLTQVEEAQEQDYGRDKYALSPEEYALRIESRKERFLEAYPKQHWLEWNYDEWRAYKKLGLE